MSVIYACGHGGECCGLWTDHHHKQCDSELGQELGELHFSRHSTLDRSGLCCANAPPTERRIQQQQAIMTAHHRPLARLPLEVFEPLVAAFAAGPVLASGDGFGFGGGIGVDDCDCDPAADPPAARIEERHARLGEEEFGSSGSDDNEGPVNDEDSSAAASRIVVAQQRKRRRMSIGGDVGAGADARTATETATTTTKTIRHQICSKLAASSTPATAASARLPQDALVPSHARTNPPRHGAGSTAAVAADGAATTTAAPFHDEGMGGSGDFNSSTVVTANVPCPREGAATPGSAATATASTHSIRTVGQLLSTDVHDLMRKLDPLLTAGTYVRH
jgi:hypothetical protein